MKWTHERGTDVNGAGHAADALNRDFHSAPRTGSDPGGPARISPWAFLRAMIAIAWSAFRHPFTTTVVDLSTGRVVREA